MNIVSEYIFAIQSMGYRPFMEKVAYYLFPIIPIGVFFTSLILGYKARKLKKVFCALGIVELIFVTVFFLKIRLPGHRAKYAGWEGIERWGIVPSQESAIVIFMSVFTATIMALFGYLIGKTLIKCIDVLKEYKYKIYREGRKKK